MPSTSPVLDRDLDALPRIVPGVLHQTLPEGAVLFSAEEEVYFGLCEVASRVWALLESGCTRFDDLCAGVHAAFPDADPTELQSDLRDLLAELAGHRLVVAD